jgi:hypothetical protein
MESIIEKIILTGESQSIEFKTSLSSYREGIKSAVAFLNTNEGTGCVFFGIRDNRFPVGLEGNMDSSQKTLKNAFQEFVCPEIMPSIELKILDNKKIIYLKVKRLNHFVLYQYDGKIYVRVGSQNKQCEKKLADQIIKERINRRYTDLEIFILEELYRKEGRETYHYAPCELKHILEDKLIQKSSKKFGNSLNLPMFEYLITNKGRQVCEKVF